jgi:hypothetical protein
VALERGNDPVPDLTADMTVAAFFGNVQLAADLEAIHGSHGDGGRLTDRSVARIAKGRVHQLVCAKAARSNAAS